MRNRETTPDGREGWSDLFLKKGYAAFLVDQPRRGEAGATISMTSDGFLDTWAEDSKDYKPGDQAWYTHFRIGRVAPPGAVLEDVYGLRKAITMAAATAP